MGYFITWKKDHSRNVQQFFLSYLNLSDAKRLTNKFKWLDNDMNFIKALEE